MKRLTNKEEKIMHILWKIQKGFVRDILMHIPEPKPSYNTISTIIRILEKKGFVDHETFGPTHRYYPLISKDNYTRQYLNDIVQIYFGNSYRQLVSFFAREKKLTPQDLEEIIQMIKNNE
jgi:BlaI family penicillinase repressor